MKGVSFMRKRFQYGSLFRRGKNWVAQWWEDGHRRKRTLGPISKTEARQELAKILSPINERWNPCSAVATLTDLIGQVYLPLYRRKWKRSTTMANENRIAFHVAAELGARALRSIHREELQAFLDRKAASGLSYSVVAHLRWDLKQILALAVAEGILCRNPAELLFTPRDCPRPATRIMTIEQVRLLLSVLALRERLIARLAIVAGMRPGEIFALKWSRLEAEYADIRQRVYRGDLDSPKSPYSVRWAALSDGLRTEIALWRSMSLNSDPDSWVFPSERLTTPLSKDNCWRRHFLPKLSSVDLGWVNFHVMRKTHSCLLKELDVDPQIRAEQMGHTVDVNENVYTRTSLERRLEAVNKLESALRIM
jgi:integrase